jgi:hypothetical protein
MQEEELLQDVLTTYLLLGAVCLHAKWRVYAGTEGEWTLDYPAYDPDDVPLLMLVDFDKRLFVHGYSEPVEPKSNYIPAGWTGIVNNPLDYTSEEIRQLWIPS